MKTAVLRFPGSNCDRDMAVALQKVTGKPAEIIWHQETTLPSGLDLLAIPGGFSYGDYLRCGAMAGHAPIMQAVKDYADKGGRILGVCNGFQILCETGLLPGALLRNQGIKFICKQTQIKAANDDQALSMPIAHHDGNYFIDAAGLASLQDGDQVAYTYVDNPNGSLANIAGIYNKRKTILGMMPHPERAVDGSLAAGDQGRVVLERVLAS